MSITTLLQTAMRLKAFLTDDESAVSPVIGVILMVAITVILAAVIASFVLGLGPSAAAPTVNFDSEINASNVNITVTGGDTVPVSQLSIAGAKSQPWGVGNASGSADGETAVRSGDTKDILGLSSGDEIRVVWSAEDGGSTQTLATYTTE